MTRARDEALVRAALEAALEQLAGASAFKVRQMLKERIDAIVATVPVEAAERDAEIERLRQRLDAAEMVIDAATVWAFCPAAGGYKDGPAIEDTCEALGAAVQQYLGVDIDTPPDEWWTVEEMHAALAAKAKP